MALCGCSSRPHHQPVARAVELTLYETNQKPLANLQLLLPTAVSTNWSNGQWRGELSAGHVSSGEHISGAEFMLNAPSWRRLICRIDPEDARLIRINLQPEQPMDHINVWLPAQKGLPAQTHWYEWTDAGGCGGGDVSVHP